MHGRIGLPKMNAEYYPFRQISLPQLGRTSLTHELMPTISADRSSGQMSFWTMVAEVDR